MSLKCLFSHQWNGCKCERCGKIRGEGHRFERIQNTYDEKCSICGKTQKITCTHHSWKGCICKNCGVTRDEQHNWVKPMPDNIYNVVCSECGIGKIDISMFSTGEKAVLGFAGIVFATSKGDLRAAENLNAEKIIKQKYLDVQAFAYAVMSLEMFGEDIVKNIKSQFLVGKEAETYRSTLAKAQKIKKTFMA